MRLPTNILDKFYMKAIKIYEKSDLFAEINSVRFDLICLTNGGDVWKSGFVTGVVRNSTRTVGNDSEFPLLAFEHILRVQRMDKGAIFSLVGDQSAIFEFHHEYQFLLMCGRVLFDFSFLRINQFSDGAGRFGPVECKTSIFILIIRLGSVLL